MLEAATDVLTNPIGHWLQILKNVWPIITCVLCSFGRILVVESAFPPAYFYAISLLMAAIRLQLEFC